MTQYDPNVIYRFATRLYSRAQLLVLTYTVMGVLAGGGLGKAYKAYAEVTASPSNALLSVLRFGQAAQPSPPVTDWTLIGTLVMGLLGFWIGWNKASFLKLQAQTALCQAKIEENTRSNLRSQAG